MLINTFWLLLFLLLPLGACSDSTPGEKAPRPNLSLSHIQTVRVERSRVENEVVFDGVIDALNQAIVSAQTSGRIVELPYDVGDYVAKDAIIVRITDTEQRAAQAAANAQLQETLAYLTEAQQNLNRISEVFEKGLVAKSDFDRADSTHKAALARVESARAVLKNSEERLSHTQIEAPYSGILVKRLTDVGATVSPGSPLLEGLSLDHLRVLVDVPHHHIGPLRQHKKARVLLDFGKSLQVNEMRIPPGANTSSHSFQVILTLPEGQQDPPIFPGSLVKVAFVAAIEEKLLIPADAIAYRGEVTAVYVVSEAGIEFRYIRPGQKTAEDRVTILSGLSEGEEIISDPVAGAKAYKISRN